MNIKNILSIKKPQNSRLAEFTKERIIPILNQPDSELSNQDFKMLLNEAKSLDKRLEKFSIPKINNMGYLGWIFSFAKALSPIHFVSPPPYVDYSLKLKTKPNLDFEVEELRDKIRFKIATHKLINSFEHKPALKTSICFGNGENISSRQAYLPYAAMSIQYRNMVQDIFITNERNHFLPAIASSSPHYVTYLNGVKTSFWDAQNHNSTAYEDYFSNAPLNRITRLNLKPLGFFNYVIHEFGHFAPKNSNFKTEAGSTNSIYFIPYSPQKYISESHFEEACAYLRMVIDSSSPRVALDKINDLISKGANDPNTKGANLVLSFMAKEAKISEESGTIFQTLSAYPESDLRKTAHNSLLNMHYFYYEIIDSGSF